MVHAVGDELGPDGGVAEGGDGAFDGLGEFIGGFVVKDKAVFAFKDGVGEAAGVADYRDCAIAHGEHLAEAARFEGAGHEEDVGSGIDSLG